MRTKDMERNKRKLGVKKKKGRKEKLDTKDGGLGT